MNSWTVSRDQVVEVERAGRVLAPLVLRVDPRDRLLVEVVGAPRVLVGVHHLVLRPADRRGHRLRREPLRIQVEVLQHPGDQPLGVAVVVDREARRDAQVVVLAPQDAGARRVEREDPHALGDAPADQALDAVGHLARRLVRERDRQDRAGVHAELADQVRDAVRQRARLPRAGAGHDEHGPLRMEDGLGLDVVQAFEQGGADAHEPIVGARDDRPGGDARRVAPDRGTLAAS